MQTALEMAGADHIQQDLQHSGYQTIKSHLDDHTSCQIAVGTGGGGFELINELIQGYLVIFIGKPDSQEKEKVCTGQDGC